MAPAKVVTAPDEEHMTSAAECVPILYRDEHYVVVDKPIGLLVHRTAIDAREPRSLLQMLHAQIGCRVHPIHRLDKGTSGVVVFALHVEAANRLARAFREERIDKRYLAVVRGYAPERAVVDWPLRDAIDPRSTRRNTELRPAVTEVQRLALVELSTAVGRYATARYSLVDCRPRSGRQHQIRRHLKHLRHPVIGDANYGDLAHNRFFRDTLGVGRMLLAATEISFAHPYGDTDLRIAAPLEESFRRVLDDLGWKTPAGALPLPGRRDDDLE
jgi:tRNA pseudouridine65 synthase